MGVTLLSPPYAGIGPECRGPAATEDSWADLGIRGRPGQVRGPESAPTCILVAPARAPIYDMRGSGEAVGAVSDLLEGRGMASDNLPAIRVQTAPATPRSAPPPFATAPEEPGLDWRRIASALLRFKWLVLLIGALGTAAGVV